MLGKDAFISVVHTDKEGKTFANIAAVMKPPKGMTAQVDAVEQLLHWSMAEPDWAVFAQLNSRLADQISAIPEFKLLTPPKSVTLPTPTAPAAPVHTPAPTPRATAPAPAPQAPAAVDTGSGFDDFSDDIPF